MHPLSEVVISYIYLGVKSDEHFQQLCDGCMPRAWEDLLEFFESAVLPSADGNLCTNKWLTCLEGQKTTESWNINLGTYMCRRIAVYIDFNQPLMCLMYVRINYHKCSFNSNSSVGFFAAQVSALRWRCQCFLGSSAFVLLEIRRSKCIFVENVDKLKHPEIIQKKSNDLESTE